jgi:transposase
MLALATSGEGAIPVFLRPLEGNASDQRELAQTLEALVTQLRAAGEEPGLDVADAGVYRVANLQRCAQVGVRWISRVPATSREATALLSEEGTSWQARTDGQTRWYSRQVELAQGTGHRAQGTGHRAQGTGHRAQGRERWIVVVTGAGLARARATRAKRARRDLEQWERQLWHLSNRAFACQADAEAEQQRQLKTLPVWLRVAGLVHRRPHDAGKGRPPKQRPPDHEMWHVQAQVSIDAEQREREAQRQARFVVATNLLDPAEAPDDQIISTYTAQTGVERGFAFLKDPLFLASSVFLKRPERIMALAFLMVLCLLVYRLAEWRLRQQLAASDQTVPNQLNQPTNRPTMRWLFECFEGINLLTLPGPSGPQTLIHGLESLHQLVLRLLGPSVSKMYESSN